jgi:hypothetical protein
MAERCKSAFAHGFTNAMRQKPRGFDGETENAGELV